MEPIAYQLRDIHGLDPVPWWPPAAGWWVLLFALVLTLWLLWRFWPGLRLPVLVGITWRWDAARQLMDLRRRLNRQEVKQSAAEFSELLRRIAMARHGRDACAGLTGDSWLHWLAENDPKNFDWPAHGAVLLNLPYAPPGNDEARSSQLRTLIDAAQHWISRDDGKEKPADV